MSYQLTWQFDGTQNRANGGNGNAKNTATYIPWYFMAALTGNINGMTTPGATLVGSCDGVTSGLDATDRLHLASGFTAADWVRAAAAGTAHTWGVVQLATQDNSNNVFLIWDYVSSSDAVMQLVLGRGTLTQGALISGSIRQRPTCTSEVVVNSTQTLTDGSTANHTIHGAVATNGAFAIHNSKDGTSRFWFGIIGGFTTENDPNNPNKFWLAVSYAASGDIWKWIPTTGFIGMYGGTSGGAGTWTRAGTATAAGWLPTMPYTPATGLVAVNSSTLTGVDPNIVTGYVPQWRIDSFDGATAGAVQPKGRLQDIYWCGQARVDGNTIPVSGTPEYMAVGELWIVTNVAPSL